MRSSTAPRVPFLSAMGIIAAAFALSCDSSAVEPLGPGQVRGLLVSPNGPEAAVVLLLAGEGLGTIESDSGYVFVEEDGSTARIVIVRDEPGTIAFRVAVPERTEPPDVTVLEVADGSNELRRNPTQYRVDFSPVPDSLASLARVNQ